MPEDLQTRWESSFSRLPPRTTSTWKRCSGPSPPWSSSRRRTRRRDWTIPQKSTSPKVDMGGRIKRQTPKASAASKGKTIIDNFLSWQIRFSDSFCEILIENGVVLKLARGRKSASWCSLTLRNRTCEPRTITKIQEHFFLGSDILPYKLERH